MLIQQNHAIWRTYTRLKTNDKRLVKFNRFNANGEMLSNFYFIGSIRWDSFLFAQQYTNFHFHFDMLLSSTTYCSFLFCETNKIQQRKKLRCILVVPAWAVSFYFHFRELVHTYSAYGQQIPVLLHCLQFNIISVCINRWPGSLLLVLLFPWNMLSSRSPARSISVCAFSLARGLATSCHHHYSLKMCVLCKSEAPRTIF